ncbi:MAG TPA: hypothetical protein VER39_08095 [Nocardioidaceae bacterium]|nr:hypothetical protein [Nocardioidaceae bacterium]
MPVPVAPVPELLRGLVDDAAVLPPGEAPLEAAVREHAGHRRSTYAAVLGSFAVLDRALPRLVEAVAAVSPDRPLPVTVVVSGGAGALQPAVAWATRSERLALRSVVLAVRESDAGDLAPNARRIVTAADALVAGGALDEDVTVHLEPPRLHGAAPSASWLGVLDEVAAADLRLTLRAGGADGAGSPGAQELATCMVAALDRELAFTCTGGPHRAVRHRDHAGCSAGHGLLNVLAGTRAALDGAGPADVAAALEEQDPSRLLQDTEALASARRWFRSFGSCDVPGTLADLTALGLLVPGS